MTKISEKHYGVSVISEQSQISLPLVVALLGGAASVIGTFTIYATTVRSQGKRLDDLEDDVERIKETSNKMAVTIARIETLVADGYITPVAIVKPTEMFIENLKPTERVDGARASP